MLCSYLVGFCYHDPQGWTLHQAGIDDYESFSALFIEAQSQEEAISWAEKVAEEFFQWVNGNEALDWKEMGYFCWLEEKPESSSWSHCLNFFQKISVGSFPNYEAMTTESYIKWAAENGIKYT